MKRAKQILWILCASAFLIVFGDSMGQLYIAHLEKKNTTGLFAEDILSHKEPLIGFGLKKNLDLKAGYWHIKTNALGLREQNLPEAKLSDEIRIFIVGGSTVFGWGVDQEHSIPSYLQKLCDDFVAKTQASKKIRIINAGVPWYASWHETSLILFRILKLDPDAILILDGLNDTAQAILPNWRPIHLGFIDLATEAAYEKRQSDDQNLSLASTLLNLSPSLRYFQTKMRSRKQMNEGIYRPEVWTQYASYMTDLSALTEKAKVFFSVFMQPVMALEKELTEFEIQTNGTSLKNPIFADTFRKTYLFGEQFLIEQKTFRFQSLKTAFKNETDSMYIDGLHYSELGNEKLARILFEKEVKLLLGQKTKHTKSNHLR